MENSKNSTQTFIRCIEFFSGIGGLHYAFKQAWSNGEVIASFDINIVANSVYKYNFGKNPITKCIESLNVDDIEKYEANCWLLSPPCQPYTRGGKGLDDQDQRAKGLMHLIEILPKLSKSPEYIFLENVLNFEKSRSREKLIIQLHRMNYEIHECLLTSLQFGIPNDRLRYYLMARKKIIIYENIGENIENLEKKYLKQSTTNIHRSWPFECMLLNNNNNNNNNHNNSDNKKTDNKCHHNQWLINDIPNITSSINYLSNYLDDDDILNEKELENHFVKEKYILKSHDFKFDVVRPIDQRSSCFTKSYGSHHIFGSGSLIQTKKLEFTNYDFKNPKSLLELGLRFFTPTEVARLHAFPLKPKNSDNFVDNLNMQDKILLSPPRLYDSSSTYYLEFPDDVSIIQKHRLLGNSLNVFVVAELLRCVLFNY
ncbi:hypothetical protein Glove_174g46 [Diversispora epigaea]|uniref:tRNA (cytosine(38)-C(5))-methyltransferase n=1 Tax=Diversispora epigaea TaxID=1348612 RepID=A0A397IXV8_9GLOM|nr:hypothetical protein Glove_174g46 [Diversispora epigaea]